MRKVVIIGSGFGGLSAACFLSKNGFNVTVVEKNDQPGGRAMVFESKGFKYDMGPSWYMMPAEFDKVFERLGTKRENFYSVKKIEPNYRVFFSDKTKYDITSNVDEMSKIFEAIEPGSSKKFKQFVSSVELKYKLGLERFIYRNFHNFLELISFKNFLQIFDLGILQSWKSFVSGFFKTKKLQQITSWHSVFAGGSPSIVPSTYSMISYLDFNDGVYYPEKGFQSVVEAFYKIAKDNGVSFLFNEPVEKILIENGVAKGVRTTSGKEIPADMVLSNADYNFTENNLIEEKYRSYSNHFWKSRNYSAATFCIYLGVNKKLDKLVHHNYYFSDKWEEHIENLKYNSRWPDDPSIYISCPGKTDSKVAPDGMENIFVLVPVATGLNFSDTDIEDLYQKVILRIEQLAETKISESIIYKRIITPKDHQLLYNAFNGNGLGLSHTMMQTALLRPSIKSRKVKNLFYAGHYTQPGTSTFMATISGELAAQEIINYDKSEI